MAVSLGYSASCWTVKASEVNSSAPQGIQAVSQKVPPSQSALGRLGTGEKVLVGTEL